MFLDSSRRQFLKKAVVGVTALGLLSVSSGFACAAGKDWRQALLDRDRYLSLEREATGEKGVFLYFRNRKGFDMQGYSTACHLLRDVESNVTVRINPKLIDLLYIMQSWLKSKGMPYHIVITSGYRTPEHNARLRGAARDSEHVKGNAADIRIPGVSIETIRRLATDIGVGGVGFYQRKNFIHVDVGKVRSWNG